MTIGKRQMIIGRWPRLRFVIPLLAALSLFGAYHYLHRDKDVRWEGATDEDMLKQARLDVADALASHVKTLRVTINSGGGPIFTSLTIAKLVRDTSDSGLTIEIHAEVLCASGCTFVLAAGTPGHRSISSSALFLVHSMQKSGSFGGLQCVEWVIKPKTQEDKATDVLLLIMRDAYARYTQANVDTIQDWLTCGKEQVGMGYLALKMGFVDKVEG